MILQENSVPDGTLAARIMCADTDPSVLERILDADCQLAIWRRNRPDALTALDMLDWDDIDDVIETLRAGEAQDVIGPALAEAGYPRAIAEALGTEICALACRFSRVMEAPAIRMRLEVIETDACRKFHMDHVKARLLLPLSGPGTQWKYAREDAPVEHLAPGEVGVFKGRLWAEDPAILHRSPPIAGSGQTRLLLVLDPAEGARSGS